MTRITIAANAGGAKSALGGKLSALRDLPFHSVDQIEMAAGDLDIAGEQHSGALQIRLRSSPQGDGGKL